MRFAPSGLRAEPRRASSPLFHSGSGRPVVFRFPLPPMGRAERKTVRRVCGATCCRTQLMAPSTPEQGARQCVASRLTRSSGPKYPRDDRKRRKPPAFRTRMDFAACCMSRLASFCRRVPVRVGYYPDKHLGRPPVLPVVSPKTVCRSLSSNKQPGARHRCGHRNPLHDMKTLMRRPLPERDADNIFLQIGKIKLRKAESENRCARLCTDLCDAITLRRA